MNNMTPPPESAFTDEDLIFLVSQPRAGSTLLQAILSGSEAVHTTAEPWLMLHALYALRETGHTADYDATVAARALRDFLGTLAEGEEAYYSALRRMALDLYGRASREAGKTRFLDKTPRYYKILPELARVFPRARFIILLRNPAAVLSSIVRTWVGEDWNRFEYFRDDLLSAPGLLSGFVSEFGKRAVAVRYESLVLAPGETIQSLCEYLDLPFHIGMLQYGERPRPAGRYGDPSGIDRHARPSSNSLDAWLEHAKDPQVHHLLSAYLEALGAEQIGRLGYDAAELTAKLDAVPRHPGKPAVRWEQLMKDDKTTADRVRLILIEARRERRPMRTAGQIARLLVNRK